MTGIPCVNGTGYALAGSKKGKQEVGGQVNWWTDIALETGHFHPDLTQINPGLLLNWHPLNDNALLSRFTEVRPFFFIPWIMLY